MGKAYVDRFYAILLLFSLGIVGCEPPPPHSINRYYIPNNYVGDIRIYYNVPDAPALEPYNELYRIVRVPRSGMVETSSAPDYGSRVQSCSSSSSRQHYYVDDEENIVRSLSPSICQDPEIGGEASGQDTASFFVGTDEEDLGNNHCYGGQRQPDGLVFWPELPFDPNFDEQQEFYIPDRYVGFVKIMYDQAETYPELPTDPKSGKRLHHVPKSGVLRTSSKNLQEKQRNCNQKRRNYFYDSNLPKEERRLIEDKTIWKPHYSAVNGISVLTIFIGTREEFKQYGMVTSSDHQKFGGKPFKRWNGCFS